MVRLKDEVAIITGGGSGLGEAAARQFASTGAQVAIFDLPSSNAKAVAEEMGSGGHFVSCDVANPVEVAEGFDWIRETLGRIDICVNAAGIPDSARMVSSDGTPFPLETYRRVIEVNQIGTFDVMRHAALAMTHNDPGPDGERGVIINVASIAAFEGQVGQVADAASKGGVVSMTLAAARDLARWGIRVITVCPGLFDTGMLAGMDDRIRTRMLDVPVFPKRAGRPAEFGLLVEAIATNLMLNGETIRLDAAARPGPV